jgi:hypothetical protein
MKLLSLILILIPSVLFSQLDTCKCDTTKLKDLKVYLKTDINYASSKSDTRKEAQSATGTLGLKFETLNVFGSATFTIHSQNEEISTTDSLETKLFGTNLLLPQNSSSNISNFELNVGTKSLWWFAQSFSDKNFKSKKINYYIKPLGFEADFRVNNTIWQKSNISIPIVINTFSAEFTYRLLDVNMIDSDEKIRLMVSLGYTSRRLGGDYGLDKNSELRKEFIGTDRLGFDGVKFSTRLEVSKFYGQIDLTSFSNKGNIAGFSGNQAIVSLGIRADLPLPTKVK